MLETIDSAGMLSELPADPAARADHQRAVSLLGVLRRDLAQLRRELLAAGDAQEFIARALARHAATPRAQP